METRKLIKEILAALISFVFFMGLFAFTVGADAWDYLWFIIPFFVLMLVRKKVSNFYVFMFIHLAIIGLPVWIWWGHNFFWPIIVLYGLFSAYSIARRLDMEVAVNFGTYVALVAVLGGLAFISNAFNIADIRILVNFYIFMFIVGIFATILHIQMSNMDSHLRLIDKVGSKSLYKANYVTVGVFFAVVLVFAVATVFVPPESIGAIIRLPFSFLASIFRRTEPETGMGEAIPQENGHAEYHHDLYWEHLEIDPDALPPPHQEVLIEDISDLLLWDAASVVSMVLIGILIVLIMVVLFRAMLRKMRASKGKLPSDIEVEKLKMNLKGSIGSAFSRLGQRLKNPVRREYRKKVNVHIKKGAKIMLHHHTENIANIILPEEDICELTKQYEVARYGRQ